MNGEEKKMKGLTVGIAAVILIVGIVIGFFSGTAVGKSEGMRAAEERYAVLAEIAFPELSTDYSVTGTVTKIYGAAITLSTESGGVIQSFFGGTREVSVNVTASTTLSLTDYSTIATTGAPATREITLDEVNEGDTITARSAKPIEGAGEFDAVAIELVR